MSRKGPTLRRLASLLPAAALLLSLPVAAPAAGEGGKGRPPVEVGQRVPDFVLPTLEGGDVSYERQIRGKGTVTVFLFMTTACTACIEELKEIDAYVARNPGKIDPWCVAVDLRGARTVAPFQQAGRYRVRYLLDPKFTLPRVFGFSYTPSLAVVDPKGNLLFKQGGYVPGEKVSDRIKTFVR